MKKCILTNGEFSWILEVDGNTINFQGSESAQYFAYHYSNLGYEIHWK